MEGKLSFIAFIVIVLFAVSFVCTIIMLFIMIKKGDERKRYIMSKSSTTTLGVYVAITILTTFYTVLIERNNGFSIEYSPMLSLVVISIIFCITLFYNMRKHGN